MKIHKEGHKIIKTILVILLIINLIFSYEFPDSFFLYGTSFTFFILLILFFRSPDRKIEINDNNILCPADGKIVAIEEVEETEYFKERRLQVSVFMSLTNIHINRYPVSGVVKYKKYHPGRYLFAFNPKSSLINERTTIVIEKENKQSILIRQIAGALAQRIVCYAEENKQVVQGEDLGFIKFGSRVDLLLPLDVNIMVKLNQKVIGGKTIIAQ